MSHPITLAAAVLLLGGCAVSIGDSDYGDYRHGGSGVAIGDGERRVTIEELHDDRNDASRAMAAELDRLRSSDCRIERADGWRRLDNRDDEDPRGYRVIALCPAL